MSHGNPPGIAAEAVRKVRQAFGSREEARFNDADGLRIDLAEGWVCLRASNTEPIMRIFAEARDQKTVDKLIREVTKIAKALVS